VFSGRVSPHHFYFHTRFCTTVGFPQILHPMQFPVQENVSFINLYCRPLFYTKEPVFNRHIQVPSAGTCEHLSNSPQVSGRIPIVCKVIPHCFVTSKHDVRLANALSQQNLCPHFLHCVPFRVLGLQPFLDCLGESSIEHEPECAYHDICRQSA
jgi:hypothetical protein